MSSFSIIIPTLNEGGNIAPLFTRISNTFCQSRVKPEIIIVDDNSSDNTREEVEDFNADFPIKVIRRIEEKGLSTAVMAGVEAAQNDIIVVMDADLSHPPERIPALIAPILKRAQQMVIGSRYTEGGSTVGWPMKRRIASRLASLPAQILTATKDPLAGFFAIQKEFLLKAGKNAEGFKIGLEAICNNQNIKVSEIPIAFTDRSYGTSKMNSSVLTQYMEQIFRLGMLRLHQKKTIQILLTSFFVGFANIALFHLLTKTLGGPTSLHLVSFLIANAIGYTTIRKTASLQIFSLMTLFHLFMASGVLLLFEVHSPFMILSVIITTSIGWLIATFWAERPSFFKQNLLLLIISYSFVLRALFLGNIELLREEAYYWNYAQHLAPGYLDHPPMVAVLISIGTFFFGTNEFGVRIPALLCWMITAGFSYGLAYKIFNHELAIKVLAIVAVLPAFFATGFLMTPDAPLIAAWAGCLYFLYLAFIENKKSSWYMVGICLGIGLLSKYTIVFLGCAIVIYMLTSSEGRKWFFKPEPYLAAFIAILIFSPVIYWNYQNEWASFLFQSQRRIADISSFYTPEYLGSILALITPIGAWAAIKVAKHRHIRAKEWQFCLTMALVPLAIVFIFSLTKEVKLNWTAPFWLAIIPFMVAITWNTSNIKSIWPKTLITMFICFGSFMQYSAIGLPYIPFNQASFMSGWENMASQIEIEGNKIQDKEGKTPLIVGMDKYQISSGMAFYSAKIKSNIKNESIIGNSILNGNDLMYSYWYKDRTVDNSELIIVGKKAKDLERNIFANDYIRISQVFELQAQKYNQNAGSLYYTRLRKTPRLEEQGVQLTYN